MDVDQTEDNHRNEGSMCEAPQRNSRLTKFRVGDFTWEQRLAALRTMFPFVSSKTALTEQHFIRGYACSCRIFAMETRKEWESMRKYLDVATEEYQRSYEEAGTPEAIANLLWALCLGYTFSADVETVGVESGEYTRQCYETAILLIGILREYKEYEALGEYYNTLLHVIGMGGNGAGVDLYKKVG
ncbi:MAG: hypothetical protein IKT67_10815 [Lachnospiraceae bacterium]|nr:hypothetical protein [Lachnospiraceae bacterium]